MKITSVSVHKVTGENSRMKGIATVVLDDCFKIKGIRIIEKDDKMMLAMPSRKNRNNENEDVAHPLNAETREMFEKAVRKNPPSISAETYEKYVRFRESIN